MLFEVFWGSLVCSWSLGSLLLRQERQAGPRRVLRFRGGGGARLQRQDRRARPKEAPDEPGDRRQARAEAGHVVRVLRGRLALSLQRLECIYKALKSLRPRRQKPAHRLVRQRALGRARRRRLPPRRDAEPRRGQVELPHDHGAHETEIVHAHARDSHARLQRKAVHHPRAPHDDQVRPLGEKVPRGLAVRLRCPCASTPRHCFPGTA